MHPMPGKARGKLKGRGTPSPGFPMNKGEIVYMDLICLISEKIREDTYKFFFFLWSDH